MLPLPREPVPRLASVAGEPHGTGQWHAGHSEDSDRGHDRGVQGSPSRGPRLQHVRRPGRRQEIGAGRAEVGAACDSEQCRRPRREHEHARRRLAAEPRQVTAPETSGEREARREATSSLPRCREASVGVGPPARRAAAVEAAEARRRLRIGFGRGKPGSRARASGRPARTEQRLLEPRRRSEQ